VAGAATWSAPVDVSSRSTFIENPFIGFDGSGTGFASWRWQDGVGAGARGGVRVSSRAASGPFAPELAGPDAEVPPVVLERGRVLVLGEQRPNELQLAFGHTDGRFSVHAIVDSGQRFGLPAVAANNSGLVAVAYIKTTPKGRRVAKLALGRSRHVFRPRVISRRGRRINAITVAVGSRGDLVVAWERDGRVEARIARPDRALGRVVLVGRGAKLGTSLRAAVAANGRVWIAWSSQSRSEGGDTGPFTLQSAASALRGSKFRSPYLLDRYDRRASDEATFDLSLDVNGNGMVAWSGFDEGNFRARFARANRRGRFVRFETLSQPGYDAVVGGLATGRRAGEAIVVWSRLDAVGEVGTVVLAGYLAPGGGYGGEEQVSRGDRARKPAVAFDLSTGHPTVVWSQREGPDGPGVPLANVRTFLRASTRSP
jgi:hypothetical protein